MSKLKTLNDLMVEHLRDLYNAETQIMDALPKMAEKATAPQLRKAFETHLEESKVHRARLEDVFKQLGENPEGHTCKAMEGIIKEGDEFMKERAEPEVMDAGLIAAGQRVEHYEMAGYGCVRTWAKQLGMNDVAKVLQTTLDEEGATDEKLTKLAEGSLNERAIS